MRRKGYIQHAVVVVLSLGMVCGVIFQSAEAAEKNAILYMFWGDGCQYCEKEREFLLEDLSQRYPEMEMRFFEIWKHPEFQQLSQTLRQIYAIEKKSVPITIIGEWNTVGFGSPETTGVDIENQIKRCLEEGCSDPLDKIGPQMIAARIKNEAAKQEPTDWELFPASQTAQE